MKYIRPVMSFTALGAFVWGFIVGKIQPETFVVTAVALIIWWFKARDEAKANGSK